MTVLAALIFVVTILALGLAASRPRRWHRHEADDEGISEAEARERLYPDGNVQILPGSEGRSD